MGFGSYLQPQTLVSICLSACRAHAHTHARALFRIPADDTQLSARLPTPERVVDGTFTPLHQHESLTYAQKTLLLYAFKHVCIFNSPWLLLLWDFSTMDCLLWDGSSIASRVFIITAMQHCLQMYTGILRADSAQVCHLSLFWFDYLTPFKCNRYNELEPRPKNRATCGSTCRPGNSPYSELCFHGYISFLPFPAWSLKFRN